MTCASCAVSTRVLLTCLMVAIALVKVAGAAYLDPSVEYADDRFIVKLHSDVGELEPVMDGNTVRVFDSYLTSLNQKWDVVKVERLFVGPENDPIAKEFGLPDYWRFWVGKQLTRESLEQVLAEYATVTLVEHTEPVGIHPLFYSPNDPGWPNQWYLRNTAGDHDIDAVEGWDIQRGDSTAILGITDTGVLYTHPDLQARRWLNWPEKNGAAGVDDDGNGFVDDSVGYDFVASTSGCASGEDCNTADNNPSDHNGHGTHCSGIAAAVTNNSTGVCGIAGGGGTFTGARIMALRIGWSTWFGGGYVGMDFAAQAFNYGRVKGVCAFNCSWGNDNSGGLGAATDAAIAAGIVICVAAGNNNNQTASYLCGRTDCIAVAATDANDVKASFSSYGSWVDVSAPGVNIYSTYSNAYSPTYDYLDGTSMATPCVTGEVGLLKSHNPSWTRTQITPAILNNVDNIYDENPSYSGLLGSGRINLNLALLSAGQITVTSPNGGETWYTGTSQNITWTSQGISGNIKIEINRSYPVGQWEVLFASIANDGSEPWTVAGATGSSNRIRISSVNAPTVYDESNGNFTISTRSITVTAPNGGETWGTGESGIITWTSTGLSENVKIELNRTYPGGAWETLFASTANDGSEAWTVTAPATSTARIRITGAVTTTVGDTSDANFSIVVRSITVTSPNGGETWTVGEARNLTWTSVSIPGNVIIEINRSYAGGTWENIISSTPNTGTYPWTVTGPATTAARIRITSVSYPAVSDVSDANFTIQAPNQPPTLAHDPLDDFAPGTGTITAYATDPVVLTISSVKMFYRLIGAGSWDSLSLALTGNPNEYAASLAALGSGSYQYYLRALDNGGLATYLPANAPAGYYTFTVSVLCGSVISYDDGSAEFFSWSEGGDGVATQWAVKFGPVATPFVLCGAQFAASRSLPDAAHSQVQLFVYAANGPGGLPGTLLKDKTVGSVGNDIGGVPVGTNWATAVLKNDLGGPLVINSSEFYIAVGNFEVGKYEAFGRDANGINQHRSYFYDPCEDQWFSEDDTGNPNAKGGNRLIRALGYGLVPPQVVITPSGNDIILYWNATGASLYRIYSATSSNGPFTTEEGTSTGTSFTDVGAVGAGIMLFYQVRAEAQ